MELQRIELTLVGYEQQGSQLFMLIGAPARSFVGYNLIRISEKDTFDGL